MSRSYIVEVRSKDRTEGTPNKYTAAVHSELINATEVELESVELANTLYSVPVSSALTIVTNSGGTTDNIVITPGNYTASQLATALDAQFTGGTVIFETTRSRFLFSAYTANIQFSNATGVFVKFGLPTTLITSSTYETANSVVISTPDVLYLYIDEFQASRNQAIYSTSPTMQPKPFARIQLDAYATSIQFTERVPYVAKFSTGRLFHVNAPIQNLHVRWTDSDGAPVDFNGVDHSFSFRVIEPIVWR